jgi:predicted transposase YbfD/YdcC
MLKLEAMMGSVVKHFESLPDPRHTRNRRHLLHEVVIVAVCGTLVGCEGPTAMARWARIKRAWLQTWLRLPGGVPSRDCIRRVMSALKPEAFQACFADWIAEHRESSKASLTLINIDGKTLRRSHDRSAGRGPLHVVSAWATEHGLALGQVATDEKSNEITAIPQLLRQIDVKKAIVTIDAMGCQREIVAQIVEQKGDCVLAVKDNQPKLCAAIEDFFSEHLENDLADVDHRRHETTNERAHGRLDDRYYYLAKLPEDFPLREQWPWIKAIGMAVRVTEQSNGKHSDQTRYYISTRYLSGERFAEAVRGHWGIENTLHWQLDVNYREDDNRARKRHLPDNLAWLRRFAISLLLQHPSQDSLKGKRQSAGWSEQFLMEVLTGTNT